MTGCQVLTPRFRGNIYHKAWREHFVGLEITAVLVILSLDHPELDI
jgi:hypothetical protein